VARTEAALQPKLLWPAPCWKGSIWWKPKACCWPSEQPGASWSYRITNLSSTPSAPKYRPKRICFTARLLTIAWMMTFGWRWWWRVSSPV